MSQRATDVSGKHPGKGLSIPELRRAASRHRALLAGGLAAAAVAAGLTALSPAAIELRTVVTAARDLTPGAALTLDDLTSTDVPLALAPDGALPDTGAVVGRLAAGPVRKGELLTDVRLLGSQLLSGAASASPDDVAVPVRVVEPATAALVRPGDRIDVHAASPEGGAAASEVATGVRILSVPAADDDPGEGALLVVAAPRSTALRLAAAAVSSRLSVVVLPR